MTPTVDRSDKASIFWSHVKKGPGCWEWNGGRVGGRGYGYMGFGKKSERGTRVSWELHHGCIPDGIYVLHRCDNPKCVRPSHLFLGTQFDNMRDCVKKGRVRSKLSEADVVSIRRRVTKGETRSAIAREYGVSPSNICVLMQGKTWRHIP